MGEDMTDSRKKRMALLDNMAAAGAASPSGASSMMSANRALRSARDAVDAHHVWELDPAQIDDTRLADRLNPEDVLDLRDAIEANGQTVPILVRRNPADSNRYLLIYGRRRLEAIRGSDKVAKVRALVATMDDDASLRAQISENMARRDLSFIERALMAKTLVDSGFGNQSQVAEVLTVTKSSVSMAISVVESIGEELVRAIGAAHGIGRPRWEKLATAIEQSRADPARLADVAYTTRDSFAVGTLTELPDDGDVDPSVLAFDAVMKAVGDPGKPQNAKAPSPARARRRTLTVAGHSGGSVQRTAKGLAITLKDGAFADWIEAEAQTLIDDLHARWLQRGED
jgi:ParB family chromosome partitioning protein